MATQTVEDNSKLWSSDIHSSLLQS